MSCPTVQPGEDSETAAAAVVVVVQPTSKLQKRRERESEREGGGGRERESQSSSNLSPLPSHHLPVFTVASLFKKMHMLGCGVERTKENRGRKT